jgi:hypothetical protein
MYSILQRKRIPFYIRGIRGSGNVSMDSYEGKTARTVPQARQRSPPGEGEVNVSVVVKSTKRPQIISIRPKFLVPWEPEKDCDVVVIDGPWFALSGKTVGQDGDIFTVRFTVEGNSMDKGFKFASKQLANLEPI